MARPEKSTKTTHERARQRLSARRVILAALVGLTRDDAMSVLDGVRDTVQAGAYTQARTAKPHRSGRKFAWGGKFDALSSALSGGELSLSAIAIELYGNDSEASRRLAGQALSEAKKRGLVQNTRPGFWCAAERKSAE
jgi:hypothetical protein